MLAFCVQGLQAKCVHVWAHRSLARDLPERFGHQRNLDDVGLLGLRFNGVAPASDKVGGTEPVNRLMKEWGLNATCATGKADACFKALRAAPGAEAFRREAKTPFGLSSPPDMGRLLEKLEK